jgi:protein tyrosine phosphatase (PTP) superfamily phosphohydrolase (DUF442 family)
MVLAFCVIGSMVAETIHWDRVGAIVLVYFLGLGIAAHALDALGSKQAKPWGEVLTRTQLWLMAIIALSVAYGVATRTSGMLLAGAAHRPGSSVLAGSTGCTDPAPTRRSALRPTLVIVAALLAGALAGAAATYLLVRADTTRDTAREAQSGRVWARPIELPGAPNLHMVTATFFRGAQPTTEGFRRLERLGIRTVVNLRSGQDEASLLAGTGLGYVHIPMEAGDEPSDEQVAAVLRVLADARRAPVFLHCHHGADRTGMMAAVYRVVVCGWSRHEAVAEMTRGGFGYHRAYDEIVDYVRTFDADRLKRLAGLAEARTQAVGG